MVPSYLAGDSRLECCVAALPTELALASTLPTQAKWRSIYGVPDEHSLPRSSLSAVSLPAITTTTCSDNTHGFGHSCAHRTPCFRQGLSWDILDILPTLSGGSGKARLQDHRESNNSQ